MLDERTLFFALALIPGLLALVCASLRAGIGDDARGLGRMAFALGLVAIAAALLSIFGQLWSIAIALALWFGSMATTATAVRRFVSVDAQSWPWFAAAVPAFLLAIFLQGNAALDAWRIALVGAFFTACAAGGIHALVSPSAPARPRGAALIVLGLVVGILVSVLRAIAWPLLDIQASFLAGGTSVTWAALLGMLSCLTLVSLGLIMGASERLKAHLERLTSTDPLTGLLNRRGLQERSPKLLAFPPGSSGSHALALVDLDDFKHLNDRCGHAACDAVLVQLARVAAVQARSDDLVSRWGGEEFVVLLPMTNGESARVWAERLRAALEIELRAPDGAPVTASIGVAAATAGTSLYALHRLAEAALYHAKDSGKNRVVLA